MNDDTAGPGPNPEPEDPMAKWFSQFNTPGGQFDFQRLLAQVQQAMSSMSGRADSSGIDWAQTTSAARHMVASLGPDPTPSQTDLRQVAEAARLSSLWLDQNVAFDQLTSQPAAWSRAQWVEQTTKSWRTVAEPIATRIADALANSVGQQFEAAEGAPAELAQFSVMFAPMLRASAGSMYAMQLAKAIGKIASEIVSGSEIGVQLLPQAQIVLLPANLTRFSEGLGVPDDDVRLYLTVREEARQRLFAHVGWLGPHVLSLLEQYARQISIDVGAMTEAIDVGDMSSLTSQRLIELSEQLQGRLFSPSQTAEQVEVLGRLETLLALVEGWVDEVTANTVATWMPHAAESLAEAVRRRRATANPSQELFSTLVGLDIRPRRVRDAANMWAVLTRARGVAGRDAVWSHPDLMPTAEDLDDPLRMVEAAQQEPQADEIDLALAQLLEQAEQERRNESDEGR